MATADKVAPVTPHPVQASKDAVKPFRIWDTKGKRYVRWRYFKSELNCHRAAWLEAGWAKVGTVLEVIDGRTGRLCGQYRVHADNKVSFWR
jgi:hypothetical protein